MGVPHVSRTTKMILTVEFFLLAYMQYVLSTSLYKSYQVDRFIQQTQQENDKLEHENSLLLEDFEYYQSDAYKEKIAKQNFGLIRPGEEVIVLTKGAPGVYANEDQNDPSTEAYYRNLSNAKKWYLFFFDRERFAF